MARRIRAAAEVADILEVGVPFSDPLADGPTIQRSTFEALRQGMTLPGTIELIAELELNRPVVLFSYLNPILRYGMDRFLADAGALGVAGLILTDLPAGSDPAVESAVQASSLDLIRLIAPTTQAARLKVAVAGAQGFVYLVARLGVTGATASLSGSLADSIGQCGGPLHSRWRSDLAFQRRSRRTPWGIWPTVSWSGAPWWMFWAARASAKRARFLRRLSARPGRGARRMTIKVQRLLNGYSRCFGWEGSHSWQEYWRSIPGGWRSPISTSVLMLTIFAPSGRAGAVEQVFLSDPIGRTHTRRSGMRWTVSGCRRAVGRGSGRRRLRSPEAAAIRRDQRRPGSDRLRGGLWCLTPRFSRWVGPTR